MTRQFWGRCQQCCGILECKGFLQWHQNIDGVLGILRPLRPSRHQCPAVKRPWEKSEWTKCALRHRLVSQSTFTRIYSWGCSSWTSFWFISLFDWLAGPSVLSLPQRWTNTLLAEEKKKLALQKRWFWGATGASHCCVDPDARVRSVRLVSVKQQRDYCGCSGVGYGV